MQMDAAFYIIRVPLSQAQNKAEHEDKRCCGSEQLEKHVCKSWKAIQHNYAYAGLIRQVENTPSPSLKKKTGVLRCLLRYPLQTNTVKWINNFLILLANTRTTSWRKSTNPLSCHLKCTWISVQSHLWSPVRVLRQTSNGPGRMKSLSSLLLHSTDILPSWESLIWSSISLY